MHVGEDGSRVPAQTWDFPLTSFHNFRRIPEQFRLEGALKISPAPNPCHMNTFQWTKLMYTAFSQLCVCIRVSRIRHKHHESRLLVKCWVA